MSSPQISPVDRVRAAVAQSVACSLDELQASIGNLVVIEAAQAPAGLALGEADRSVFDPASRTTMLLADRIPEGQETQVLAAELLRHHGQDAAVAVMGEAVKVAEPNQREVVEKRNSQEPSLNSPHRIFWEQMKQDGRVWRDDASNNVHGWLTIEELGGDPNNIQKYGYNDLKLPTIQEQPGVRFEPRDLTATHPDDYPIQEYDVIATTSDGKVRHSESTFDTLEQAKTACDEFAQGASDLDLWTDVPRKMVNENHWYHHRHDLESGMVFITADGVVKLDRSVPGDGTKWYVADWDKGWSYYDSTIEPGELMSMPIEDTERAINAAVKVLAAEQQKTRKPDQSSPGMDV